MTMPRLTDLQRRFFASAEAPLEAASDGETMITDSRQGMRPMQILEEKFGAALSRQTSAAALESQGRRTPFSLVMAKPR
jgi:hypothetical protein